MRKFSTVREIVNLYRGQNGWFRIENAASNQVADVYVYGVIGWDVTAQEFIRELQSVTAPQMNVHIATEGGDVFDGIAILNALRSHPAEVTTVVDSQAFSAGSFIMQGGAHRVMMPNSTVMIHDAMSACMGNAADMAELVDRLNQASDNIASIYAERAGGTVEDWRNVMREERWYSAQEAVDAGLADEVMPLTANRESRPIVARGNHSQPTPEPEPTFDPEVFRRALQEVYQ